MGMKQHEDIGMTLVATPILRQAVTESVPARAMELNLKVFEIGYQKGLELSREP